MPTARTQAFSGSVAGGNACASVFTIDPLQDPRWSAFLQDHPRASIFHSVPWLQALRRTYGYEPIVYTTSPPGADLRNGVVFCRLRSWVCGRRLVSLPFSDHCEPLIDSAEELEAILGELQDIRRSGDWNYVEVRPVDSSLGATFTAHGFAPSQQYYLHTIDLQPQEDGSLRRFHKSSVQQRVRRAEREGLVYECGRSDVFLSKFYQLMFLARRKHHLPPPPRGWFRNLLTCMGDALQIHLASYQGNAVAGLLTLRFKNTAVYKYGGSDHAYHRLGSVPFLLARAIHEAGSSGAQVFDLGRSDCDNEGLNNFKDNWASTRTALTYWRSPAEHRNALTTDSRALRLSKRVFASLPDSMLKIAGEVLYRHVG